MPIQQAIFNSPIGKLIIETTNENIAAVLFTHTLKRPPMADETPAAASREHPLIKKCMQQLQEYFDGKRTDFDLPLQQEGSAFQQSVWAVLNDIPYGRTVSYLELSKRIGNARAIRAVGITNGKNAISIIVPCHRVIGSNGSLTGYGGGLWRKQWLPEHEAKFANGVQQLF